MLLEDRARNPEPPATPTAAPPSYNTTLRNIQTGRTHVLPGSPRPAPAGTNQNALAERVTNQNTVLNVQVSAPNRNSYKQGGPIFAHDLKTYLNDNTPPSQGTRGSTGDIVPYISGNTYQQNQPRAMHNEDGYIVEEQLAALRLTPAQRSTITESTLPCADQHSELHPDQHRGATVNSVNMYTPQGPDQYSQTAGDYGVLLRTPSSGNIVQHLYGQIGAPQQGEQYQGGLHLDLMNNSGAEVASQHYLNDSRERHAFYINRRQTNQTGPGWYPEKQQQSFPPQRNLNSEPRLSPAHTLTLHDCVVAQEGSHPHKQGGGGGGARRRSQRSGYSSSTALPGSSSLSASSMSLGSSDSSSVGLRIDSDVHDWARTHRRLRGGSSDSCSDSRSPSSRSSHSACTEPPTPRPSLGAQSLQDTYGQAQNAALSPNHGRHRQAHASTAQNAALSPSHGRHRQAHAGAAQNAALSPSHDRHRQAHGGAAQNDALSPSHGRHGQAFQHARRDHVGAVLSPNHGNPVSPTRGNGFSTPICRNTALQNSQSTQQAPMTRTASSSGMNSSYSEQSARSTKGIPTTVTGYASSNETLNSHDFSIPSECVCCNNNSNDNIRILSQPLSGFTPPGSTHSATSGSYYPHGSGRERSNRNHNSKQIVKAMSEANLIHMTGQKTVSKTMQHYQAHVTQSYRTSHYGNQSQGHSTPNTRDRNFPRCSSQTLAKTPIASDVTVAKSRYQSSPPRYQSTQPNRHHDSQHHLNPNYMQTQRQSHVPMQNQTQNVCPMKPPACSNSAMDTQRRQVNAQGASERAAFTRSQSASAVRPDTTQTARIRRGARWQSQADLCALAESCSSSSEDDSDGEEEWHSETEVHANHMRGTEVYENAEMAEDEYHVERTAAELYSTRQHVTTLHHRLQAVNTRTHASPHHSASQPDLHSLSRRNGASQPNLHSLSREGRENAHVANADRSGHGHKKRGKRRSRLLARTCLLRGRKRISSLQALLCCCFRVNMLNIDVDL